MRRAWILGTAVLFSSVAVLPAMAQTVTSVWPTVLGQSKDRPVAMISLNGSLGDNRLIADGLAITISDDLYGRGTRTYEFDTAGNGVSIGGAIEIDPPTARIYDAFSELQSVINSDPTAPVFATYEYHSAIGNNGWFMLVWKYDDEYRLTSGPPYGPGLAEANDPNDDISAGNFSTTNPEGVGTNAAPSYLQLRGADLNLLSNTGSVSLRHDVNTSEVYGGRLVYKYSTNATVSFKNLETGVGSPPVCPSLGEYDLEVNGTIVIDKAVTLVSNLLDDRTFRIHGSGSPLASYFNLGELLLSPYWRTLVPYPDTDGIRNGQVNLPARPRGYPFMTGPSGANNNGWYDNEFGSLQWSTNDGVHKFFQTIYVDFAVDTTLTLTGLWAASGDHYAMEYGGQLRAGDENGTIIAETPPGQRVATPFSWTDFSVSGVFPAGTTEVTVVFYGEHPTTSDKALHLDSLLLRVDNDHPNPPAITGMTTPNHATIGDSNATVTLTGVNLVNGQTSVTLRAPDIMVKGLMSWADVGKQLTGDRESLSIYEFTPGDKIVLTGGSNVILGAYDIAAKGNDHVITLADDINGPDHIDEGGSITGYIVKAPIAASSVNATGSQVEATFNLSGAPAGYRNIIVEVGTHDPIVWREGFNVIYPGPELVNGSFELPDAYQDCENGRVETFTPATDWKVRFWNDYLDDGEPILNYRDDFWTPSLPLPSCPPSERGVHYASTTTGSHQGTAQWSQTLVAEPGRKYVLSGYFGHSGEYSVHGTKITLSLLDGDSTAAPMVGASTVVLSGASFEDWTFGSVTGTATGNLLTVTWEVENQGAADGPRAAWIDHLVLVKSCYSPFADADADGDVDQADFSVFQLCYTGQGGTIPLEPAYCGCFDVDGAGDLPDGDIDQNDLNRFEACASGPGILADPTCDD